MEQNNPKFRLRLNLFDAVILILVLALGGGFAWYTLSSRDGGTSPAASTVRYTVMFQSMAEGNHDLIQPGDLLEDTVKNYQLGAVVSVDYGPAVVQVLDQETQTYVDTELEGFEDVYVTVESTCTDDDANGELLVGGGYDIRVGQTAYVRGPGYMGRGPVIAIERGN